MQLNGRKLNNYGQCGGLNGILFAFSGIWICDSPVSDIGLVGFGGVALLEEIRYCGQALSFQKPYAISSVLSLLPVCGLKRGFWAAAPAFMPAAVFSPSKAL